MTQEREALTAWGDDVALRGPDAPRNDGSIKHMIEYLLTVYERFGNTTITANLQWGATALWKRDEAQQRVAELEAELEALRITRPEELSAEGTPRTDANVVRGFDALRITKDEEQWVRASVARQLEQELEGLRLRYQLACDGRRLAEQKLLTLSPQLSGEKP